MDTPADSLSSRASFANGDQRFYAARGSSYSNSPDDREFGSPWDYPLDGTTTTQTPDEIGRRERDWDVETVRDWDTSDSDARRPSPSRYDANYVRSLQEEIQRLEEELKRKDEEIRKKDEEIRRKDEEAKKFEQELRKMQVEAKRKAEEEHKAREEARRKRELKKKERDAILEAESSSDSDQESDDRRRVRKAANGKTRSSGHRHEANGGHGRRIQLSYSGAASLHPPRPSTSSQPASRSASPGRTKKRPPPSAISPPASPPPARAPLAAPAHRTTNGTTTTWPAMQLPALDPAWRAQYQFEQQQREYRHQLVEQSYKPSVKEVADRVVKQMAAAQHAQMADSDWEGIRRKNSVTESRFRKPLGSRR